MDNTLIFNNGCPDPPPGCIGVFSGVSEMLRKPHCINCIVSLNPQPLMWLAWAGLLDRFDYLSGLAPCKKS